MSQNNGSAKRSEKGLLTPENCIVALIDHQPQMLFGTSNFDRQGIINSTVALAKAARVFDLPVVLSTVETSFSGNMWPQLRAVFPGQEPIERSPMNSWDDTSSSSIGHMLAIRLARVGGNQVSIWFLVAGWVGSGKI
jgi:nicotinamidase-related amidase